MRTFKLLETNGYVLVEGIFDSYIVKGDKRVSHLMHRGNLHLFAGDSTVLSDRMAVIPLASRTMNDKDFMVHFDATFEELTS